jgi:hypothetical protein
MDERYSRQTILDGVGEEGQEKWGKARLILAGEGIALDAAATALSSSGVGSLRIISPHPFNTAEWKSRFPNTQVECLDHSSAALPSTDLALVLSDDADFRRRLSRLFRKQAQPALYAWAAGSGYALFLGRHGLEANGPAGRCPCLECFEVMNPKAFAKLGPQVARLLASAAASEALLWLLSGQSPLVGKVWITSLETGVSFHHEVRVSHKCPARLTDEGATITP